MYDENSESIKSEVICQVETKNNRAQEECILYFNFLVEPFQTRFLKIKYSASAKAIQQFHTINSTELFNDYKNLKVIGSMK